MEEEQPQPQEKGMSNMGKALAANIIILLIYTAMGFPIYGLIHGPIAFGIGFILLFPNETRSVGLALILAGLIISIIGFSVCAGSIHIH